MKAVARNYIILTVSRAMDLLEQFQVSKSELGITDLSNRMSLQKNYVFRLVETLKAKKYIELNSSTGKYRLGIKTRVLGHVATSLIDYSNHARPFLNDIKQQCHETCYFSIIKDGYTYYLAGVESDLPVRVSQQVGNSRPLHCTAAGRVHLAFTDLRNQIDLLSGSEMKGFTANTITDPDVLQVELNKVAQQGYAIDDQEHDDGVMEIAAPVFDSNGLIIGALSIIGPKMRLTGTRLENELIPLICLSASQLSNDLGYFQTKESLVKVNIRASKHKIKPIKLATKPYVIGGLRSCC